MKRVYYFLRLRSSSGLVWGVGGKWTDDFCEAIIYPTKARANRARLRLKMWEGKITIGRVEIRPAGVRS